MASINMGEDEVAVVVELIRRAREENAKALMVWQADLKRGIVGGGQGTIVQGLNVREGVLQRLWDKLTKGG